MGLTLITAPTVEPVSLSDAKLMCKVDLSADDSLFTILIQAARERAEGATNRAWLSQTWEFVLDQFPDDGFIELPKPPLQTVSSVKYVDTTGTLQTWAATNYLIKHDTATPPVLAARQPRGVLSLAWGVVWPLTRGTVGDVRIRFVCGYGTAAGNVPSILRQAILLDIATLYRHRDNVMTSGATGIQLPGGSDDIYRQYRSYPMQCLEAA